MAVDFSKDVSSRPMCERCGEKPAIRAIPKGKGKFRCLCQKCYTIETEGALEDRIRRKVLSDISKQFILTPRKKGTGDK